MFLWTVPKKERDRINALLEMQIARGGLEKAKRYVLGGGFAQERESRIAMELLARKDRVAHLAWLQTPEGASTRQAIAAERTLVTTWAAVVISVLALVVSIVALVTDRERQWQRLQAAPTPAAPTAGTSPPSTPAAASRP